MAVLHQPDEVTQDFIARSREVSVDKWDGPYGGDNAFLADGARGDYMIGPDGKRYLDWNNGILSVIFGYGDQGMEGLVRDQVRTGVIHTSSVYLNRPVVEFKELAAGALKGWGDYKILPASSGTIADSMALRVALANVPEGRPVRYIIPAMGYSGADFRANAMCGVPVWKGKTTPHIEGVQFIEPEFSDLAPFDPAKQVKAQDVSKWFKENVGDARDEKGPVPIALAEAGELGIGGFRTMTTEWMMAFVREIRKRNGIFICDCVQTFPGRTETGDGREGGNLWGFERWAREDRSLTPDIVTTAKGLGNGWPIGLTAVRKDLADNVDGKWFDTFAANPVAAAVAGEVLYRTQKGGETESNIQNRACNLRDGLAGIAGDFGGKVRKIVGQGLMSGLAVAPEKAEAVRAAAQEEGLLIALGSDGTLRLAPHFDTTEKSIEDGIRKLSTAIRKAA